MADLQKEIRIRRRIESIFNKKREDFASLKEYGDYEEQREDIIFNLSQGIDVDVMEEKVAIYQRENYEEILRNEAQKAEAKRQKIDAQAPPNEEAKSGASKVVNEPSAGTSGPQLPGFEQASLPPAPVALATENQADISKTPNNSAADDREMMGIVCGWHPDIPKRRAIEEAYSSVLVV